MPTTITPANYILGPAEVYYRAIGVNTPWTNIGATLDDAVLRLTTTRFIPDNLAGVMGPVMGLDYLRKVEAEFEFTLPDITGSQLTLAIPGVRTTAAVFADAGGSPLSTTLSGATLAGVTSITVASGTNAAVGDYIRIDASTLLEYRQLTSVAGAVLGFRDPLLFAHANGVAVVETTGDKRTLIQSPITRRLPDTEYREWALVVSNGSAPTEWRIPRGVSTTETSEITMGEETLAGIRVTVGARYTGTDLTISPFNLYAPA